MSAGVTEPEADGRRTGRVDPVRVVELLDRDPPRATLRRSLALTRGYSQELVRR